MRPQILGILNLTADSFSDGGRFLDPDAALAHAQRLRADGADLIDVGAESSHPRATAVADAVEISRLTPVVTALKQSGARVSVDTYKPVVMRRMLELGVDMINDVTGFANAESVRVVRDSGVQLIVMHAVHTLDSNLRPLTARAEHFPVSPGMIVTRVEKFLGDRIATLLAADIAPQRLILDPGMGVFLGSDPLASVAVLKSLPRLRKLGYPLCICTSRKSFLAGVGGGGHPAPPAERGPATLATELFAAAKGVEYVRTHDVRALTDALAIWNELQSV